VPKTRTVEAYLARVPEPARSTLEDLRATIAAAAPEATQEIAYDMPAFREDGRFLVSFAAYKRHCSLFPASQAVMAELGGELDPYLSGKGTLRFPPDDPIPPELVRRIVKIRLAEVRTERRRG